MNMQTEAGRRQTAPRAARLQLGGGYALHSASWDAGNVAKPQGIPTAHRGAHRLHVHFNLSH